VKTDERITPDETAFNKLINRSSECIECHEFGFAVHVRVGAKGTLEVAAVRDLDPEAAGMGIYGDLRVLDLDVHTIYTCRL